MAERARAAPIYLAVRSESPWKSIKELVDGVSCFLLERGQPGFTIGRVHDKMGERLANNAELVFQDCVVPDANLVGELNQGSAIFAQFSRQSNAYAGATVLGAYSGEDDR
jgi:alkylation response protein AidB-like acyl-CoA dehydrogenase